MKKYLIIIIVVVIVALLTIGGIFAWNYYWSNYIKTPPLEPIVGGDRDEHGCIGSAGYSWCEAKQKCLRSWEEPCELDQTTIIKNKLIGTKISYIGEDIKERFFEIKEENILSVDTVQCGYINYKLVEEDCYRAVIGVRKPQILPLWYIYFDKNTLEQVKKEQLFVT